MQPAAYERGTAAVAVDVTCFDDDQQTRRLTSSEEDRVAAIRGRHAPQGRMTAEVAVDVSCFDDDRSPRRFSKSGEDDRLAYIATQNRMATEVAVDVACRMSTNQEEPRAASMGGYEQDGMTADIAVDVGCSSDAVLNTRDEDNRGSGRRQLDRNAIEIDVEVASCLNAATSSRPNGTALPQGPTADRVRRTVVTKTTVTISSSNHASTASPPPLRNSRLLQAHPPARPLGVNSHSAQLAMSPPPRGVSNAPVVPPVAGPAYQYSSRQPHISMDALAAYLTRTLHQAATSGSLLVATPPASPDPHFSRDQHPPPSANYSGPSTTPAPVYPPRSGLMTPRERAVSSVVSASDEDGQGHRRRLFDIDGEKVCAEDTASCTAPQGTGSLGRGYPGDAFGAPAGDVWSLGGGRHPLGTTPVREEIVHTHAGAADASQGQLRAGENGIAAKAGRPDQPLGEHFYTLHRHSAIERDPAGLRERAFTPVATPSPERPDDGAGGTGGVSPLREHFFTLHRPPASPPAAVSQPLQEHVYSSFTPSPERGGGGGGGEGGVPPLGEHFFTLHRPPTSPALQEHVYSSFTPSPDAAPEGSRQGSRELREHFFSFHRASAPSQRGGGSPPRLQAHAATSVTPVAEEEDGEGGGEGRGLPALREHFFSLRTALPECGDGDGERQRAAASLLRELHAVRLDEAAAAEADTRAGIERDALGGVALLAKHEVAARAGAAAVELRAETRSFAQSSAAAEEGERRRAAGLLRELHTLRLDDAAAAEAAARAAIERDAVSGAALLAKQEVAARAGAAAAVVKLRAETRSFAQSSAAAEEGERRRVAGLLRTLHALRLGDAAASEADARAAIERDELRGAAVLAKRDIAGRADAALAELHSTASAGARRLRERADAAAGEALQRGSREAGELSGRAAIGCDEIRGREQAEFAALTAALRGQLTFSARRADIAAREDACRFRTEFEELNEAANLAFSEVYQREQITLDGLRGRAEKECRRLRTLRAAAAAEAGERLEIALHEATCTADLGFRELLHHAGAALGQLRGRAAADAAVIREKGRAALAEDDARLHLAARELVDRADLSRLEVEGREACALARVRGAFNAGNRAIRDKAGCAGRERTQRGDVARWELRSRADLGRLELEAGERCGFGRLHGAFVAAAWVIGDKARLEACEGGARGDVARRELQDAADLNRCELDARERCALGLLHDAFAAGRRAIGDTARLETRERSSRDDIARRQLNDWADLSRLELEARERCAFDLLRNAFVAETRAIGDQASLEAYEQAARGVAARAELQDRENLSRLELEARETCAFGALHGEFVAETRAISDTVSLEACEQAARADVAQGELHDRETLSRLELEAREKCAFEVLHEAFVAKARAISDKASLEAREEAARTDVARGELQDRADLAARASGELRTFASQSHLSAAAEADSLEVQLLELAESAELARRELRCREEVAFGGLRAWAAADQLAARGLAQANRDEWSGRAATALAEAELRSGILRAGIAEEEAAARGALRRRHAGQLEVFQREHDAAAAEASGRAAAELEELLSSAALAGDELRRREAGEFRALESSRDRRRAEFAAAELEAAEAAARRRVAGDEESALRGIADRARMLSAQERARIGVEMQELVGLAEATLAEVASREAVEGGELFRAACELPETGSSPPDSEEGDFDLSATEPALRDKLNSAAPTARIGGLERPASAEFDGNSTSSEGHPQSDAEEPAKPAPPGSPQPFDRLITEPMTFLSTGTDSGKNPRAALPHPAVDDEDKWKGSMQSSSPDDSADAEEGTEEEDEESAEEQQAAPPKRRLSAGGSKGSGALLRKRAASLRGTRATREKKRRGRRRKSSVASLVARLSIPKGEHASGCHNPWCSACPGRGEPHPDPALPLSPSDDPLSPREAPHPHHHPRKRRNTLFSPRTSPRPAPSTPMDTPRDFSLPTAALARASSFSLAPKTSGARPKSASSASHPKPASFRHNHHEHTASPRPQRPRSNSTGPHSRDRGDAPVKKVASFAHDRKGAGSSFQVVGDTPPSPPLQRIGSAQSDCSQATDYKPDSMNLSKRLPSFTRGGRAAFSRAAHGGHEEPAAAQRKNSRTHFADEPLLQRVSSTRTTAEHRVGSDQSDPADPFKKASSFARPRGASVHSTTEDSPLKKPSSSSPHEPQPVAHRRSSHAHVPDEAPLKRASSLRSHHKSDGRRSSHTHEAADPVQRASSFSRPRAASVCRKKRTTSFSTAPVARTPPAGPKSPGTKVDGVVAAAAAAPARPRAASVTGTACTVGQRTAGGNPGPARGLPGAQRQGAVCAAAVAALCCAALAKLSTAKAPKRTGAAAGRGDDSEEDDGFSTASDGSHGAKDGKGPRRNARKKGANRRKGQQRARGSSAGSRGSHREPKAAAPSREDADERREPPHTAPEAAARVAVEGGVTRQAATPSSLEDRLSEASESTHARFPPRVSVKEEPTKLQAPGTPGDAKSTPAPGVVVEDRVPVESSRTDTLLLCCPLDSTQAAAASTPELRGVDDRTCESGRQDRIPKERDKPLPCVSASRQAMIEAAECGAEDQASVDSRLPCEGDDRQRAEPEYSRLPTSGHEPEDIRRGGSVPPLQSDSSRGKDSTADEKNLSIASVQRFAEEGSTAQEVGDSSEREAEDDRQGGSVPPLPIDSSRNKGRTAEEKKISVVSVQRFAEEGSTAQEVGDNLEHEAEDDRQGGSVPPLPIDSSRNKGSTSEEKKLSVVSVQRFAEKGSTVQDVTEDGRRGDSVSLLQIDSSRDKGNTVDEKNLSVASVRRFAGEETTAQDVDDDNPEHEAEDGRQDGSVPPSQIDSSCDKDNTADEKKLSVVSGQRIAEEGSATQEVGDSSEHEAEDDRQGGSVPLSQIDSSRDKGSPAGENKISVVSVQRFSEEGSTAEDVGADNSKHEAEDGRQVGSVPPPQNDSSCDKGSTGDEKKNPSVVSVQRFAEARSTVQDVTEDGRRGDSVSLLQIGSSRDND
ncbi:hypothetical protein DIPPA_18208, partial [Diplonema papillatum]